MIFFSPTRLILLLPTPREGNLNNKLPLCYQCHLNQSSRAANDTRQLAAYCMRHVLNFPRFIFEEAYCTSPWFWILQLYFVQFKITAQHKSSGLWLDPVTCDPKAPSLKAQNRRSSHRHICLWKWNHTHKQCWVPYARRTVRATRIYQWRIQLHTWMRLYAFRSISVKKPGLKAIMSDRVIRRNVEWLKWRKKTLGPQANVRLSLCPHEQMSN